MFQVMEKMRERHEKEIKELQDNCKHDRLNYAEISICIQCDDCKKKVFIDKSIYIDRKIELNGGDLKKYLKWILKYLNDNPDK